VQDVENQKVGVIKEAERRGLVIDKYITDEAVSGGVEPEKRELGKLLKHLQDGDVLIAGEISRLGRTLFMVIRILEHCMKVGVKVYTHKDGYELGDNIQSKVLAFAFGLAAEIERKMISERTKEALARKKLEGVILGRPIGAKSARVKLSGHEDDIRALLKMNFSKGFIAKKFKVNRNTLLTFCKERMEDGMVFVKPYPEHLRKDVSDSE
jgi:DNA invertase Pin-like site-specific DNA recombinase